MRSEETAQHVLHLGRYVETNRHAHDRPTAHFSGGEVTDPFMVTENDLVPPRRLLRCVKSGERVPVTLRVTQKRVDVGLRLAAIPLGSTTTHLYGIEYDDPARGKHEGVYEGEKLFEPRQKGRGAGAFLLKTEDLRRGYTFAEALSERYDVDIPGSSRLKKGNEAKIGEKGIALGSSGIVVEAPGLEEVRRRMSHLRRLQSIGLEGYNVCRLGGDEHTKSFLRDNLTSLTTLDLSNNLFTYWLDIAEIVACVPTLRKVVLNNSRIERLAPHLRNFEMECLIREAFKEIRELELCNSYTAWSDLVVIAPFLTQMERLDLVDNTPLTTLGSMRTLNGVPVFTELRYLNLAGCGIDEWEDLMRSIKALKRLETLDLSHSPLDQILPMPSSVSSVNIPNLILLSTKISTWTSIDALQQWTAGSLTSLKFSTSPSTSPGQSTDPALQMSGDQGDDRLIIIAKLPALTSLNATPVNSSERRDAEMAYVKLVDGLIGSGKSEKALWGRYDELKAAHGVDTGSQQGVDLRLGHMRSRLYDLSVFTSSQSGILQQSATISVLPSSPMALLRKKISRSLQARPRQGIKIYTVSDKFADGERSKAVEVPDGETVSWWFGDGDEIIADLSEGDI